MPGAKVGGKRRPQVKADVAEAGQLVPSPRGVLAGRVDAGAVDTVWLAVVDAQGRLKGKEFDARFLLEKLAAGSLSPEMCGYLFDTDLAMTASTGASLASWESGFGDITLLPELCSARVLPWLPGTAVLLAHPITDGGLPLPVAPTTVLDEQLTRLAGLGLTVKAGLETEFVLYEGTQAAACDVDFLGLRPLTRDNRDYALDQSGPVSAYTRELRRVLREAGLATEAVKTEGAPGQLEVTFPYGEPVPACEGHVLFKHAARAVADQQQLAATFMAAPVTGTGSGLHLHLSLWNYDGQPVLAAETGSDDAGGGRELSEVGGQAVAGLLKVLPELGPLWAPYVNSYKRLRSHSFAPTRMVWGRDNRSCAVRVVGHGRSLHLEVRLPGADANPYFALAAAVAAIRYGIEAGLKAPEPVSGDGYAAHEAPAVPADLARAIAAMEESALAVELFGADVVAHLTHLARREVLHHQGQVTDAERRRGFAQS
ncbi:MULTISPECIES: glutamine synthetase family protein [unclassified Kitasatospora]|uniref:glutamine synthetase family protein n=1 Tax=unclassified Kitasatospora TaxID=2633591 RepID=UPI00070A3848|nr:MULTISPECIES: glutamine synthetase family protein [unclassified Kitasatospora]KQV20846.1 hypothetical protein ASC99_20265 [Kitasatospora sp. Root107]KRB60499.1 hypothetical protein ASE03_12915 [Kitasatospora sp. Root187]